MGDDIMRFELDDSTTAADTAGMPPVKRKPETGLLTIREEDGVLRARLNDRSLRSLDTHKLRSELVGLCKNHSSRIIILSMRNTETLASSVLGSLAQLSADLERVGGVLVLYKMPKEVGRVLRKTRLDRLIHTARDRSSARKKALSLARKNTAQRYSNAA